MGNMTAPYDLSGFNNATDFYGMAVASNEIAGGLFGIVILLVTMFLVFISMKGYDTKTAIMASSSFTWLVSLLLFTPLGLIGDNIFKAVSAIAIATIVISALSKD